MTSCFMNYRTGDGEHVATHVGDELSRRFGKGEVFRASDSIPAGADFEQRLRKAVRGSEVLLAVIGPRWLEKREADGLRAIDDPADWTRWEIAAAFEAGVTVIPVLIESTPRLRAADLPDDLAPLARCQYRRLRHRNVGPDLDEIAEAVLIAAPDLEERVRAREEAGTGVGETGAGTGNSMGDVRGNAVQAGEYRVDGVVVNGDHATTHTGSGDLNQNSTVNHIAGDHNSTVNNVSGDQRMRDQSTGRVDRRGRA
ncbi:toll/interleukin-1 receptor domain-containing protein [Nocardiopsis sp. NPDC007018]|uniref:toll/interleukin-1 receptor domain-containing protein n=1 Tax=Nocardiopsis sp. NPDC007018 TaxID=3155721 RepID=UPI0033E2A2EB